MAKTYVDVVKYLIKSNVEINGIVEKPDIVGAIFGQTEGLLGDELDLRELQKSGRIGRIEVDTSVRGGKCFGTITVPSSLDMVDTSILAAALEIVDRVGPCDARIAVQRIEDTRDLKRKQVLGRARDLLKSMLVSEIPESKELSEMVREEMRIADVVPYGPDALPAGPAVDSSEDIIVVEGRADVINLMRHGMKNVVGVGGANVGKTIAELCKKKEVTAFLDGDRGGDIILKELLNATEIEFVARAPPGHEVEDLSRKEIIQCLRRRVPTEQNLASQQAANQTTAQGQLGQPNQVNQPSQPMHGGMQGGDRRGDRRERYEPRHERFERRDRYERPQSGSFQPPGQQPMGQAPMQPPMNQQMQPVSAEPTPMAQPEPAAPPAQPSAPVPPEAREKLTANLKELSGSLKARFLKDDWGVAEEVPIRDIIAALSKAEGVQAVVLDGIVTQRLLDLVESKGVKFAAGIREGNITHRPATVGIVAGE